EILARRIYIPGPSERLPKPAQLLRPIAINHRAVANCRRITRPCGRKFRHSCREACSEPWAKTPIGRPFIRHNVKYFAHAFARPPVPLITVIWLWLDGLVYSHLRACGRAREHNTLVWQAI